MPKLVGVTLYFKNENGEEYYENIGKRVMVISLEKEEDTEEEDVYINTSSDLSVEDVIDVLEHVCNYLISKEDEKHETIN